MRLVVMLLVALGVAASPRPSQAAARARQPSWQATPPRASSQQTQPSSPASSSAEAPSEPVSMEPAQVRALLYKIYRSAFRVSDLLSVLQPEKLTMTDGERQSFKRRVDLLHAELQSLEKSRNEFSNQPDNLELGEATEKSLSALLPELDAFSGDMTRHGDASQGNEYKKAAQELRGLEQNLTSYVAFLEAQAGPPKAETPASAVQSQPSTSQAATATRVSEEPVAAKNPPAARQAPTPEAPPTRPAEAPQPLNPRPAEAAGSAAAQPAAPQPQPESMPPDQVRALLYKIYMSAFRVNDLLSVLDPSKLMMSEPERQSLNQTVNSLKSELGDLEKSRSQFYSQPDNLQAGEDTNKVLSALAPQISDFARELTQYGDAADASEYAKSSIGLSGLQKSLEPYVVWLEAKAGLVPARPVPAVAGLKTETITTPKSEVSPLTFANSIQPGPGYMKPADVKALLYKIYVESYRVSDLLTILHSRDWKISDTERSTLNEQVETLRAALKGLERWRGQFDKQPDSMYLAYQTYAALNAVWPSVQAVAGSVAKYENTNLGAQYGAARKALFDFEQQLSAYVAYLIGNQHQSVAALEDNLSRCQSTLGYAMLPKREAAVPMKNVVPVFKGHRRARRRAKKSATEGAKREDKKQSSGKASSAH